MPAPDADKAASGEQVLSVLPYLQRKRGMFAYDAIILVVTTERLILAQPSAAKVKQAAQEAAQTAKQEGKGALGQMWATMSSGVGYHQRYLTMTPGEILADNSKNTMLPLAGIRSVRFRNRSNDDNALDELIINSAGGRVVLQQRNMDIVRVRALLRQVVRDVR